MNKNPAEPGDTPEPEGGRAAERFRDLMRGRFPAGTPTESDEAAPEDDESAPEDEAPAADSGPAPDESPG